MSAPLLTVLGERRRLEVEGEEELDECTHTHTLPLQETLGDGFLARGRFEGSHCISVTGKIQGGFM